MRTIEENSALPGRSVRLSLSAPLQTFIAKCLASFRRGSAVVLDVKTGEILALVSHPGFDPSVFGGFLNQKTWISLRDHPDKVLLNRAMNGLYAPGSTIKGAFILSGLENRMLSPATQTECTGKMIYNNHRYHCWMDKWGGHRIVDTRDAVVRSCDIFMYQLGIRLGVDRMVETLRKLGFGEDFYSSMNWIPSMSTLPTPVWKQIMFGERWNMGDSILLSIGQGYLLASPLELAVMSARLASGKFVSPTYLKQVRPGKFNSLPFEEKNLRFVQKALFDVVNSVRGTAYRSRLSTPNYQMAGKTGTSQVRRISLEERERGVRRSRDKVWEERDHGLYIGYLPAHEPRYALAVVVDHSGSGGVAASVARDINDYIQNRIDTDKNKLDVQ